MDTAFSTAIMMPTQTAVGADLSRTPPIMAFHTITQTAVGADLSRTPPIYRPSVDSMTSFTHHCTLLACTQRSSTPMEGNP
jgi:hypothetical protein